MTQPKNSSQAETIETEEISYELNQMINACQSEDTNSATSIVQEATLIGTFVQENNPKKQNNALKLKFNIDLNTIEWKKLINDFECRQTEYGVYKCSIRKKQEIQKFLTLKKFNNKHYDLTEIYDPYYDKKPIEQKKEDLDRQIQNASKKGFKHHVNANILIKSFNDFWETNLTKEEILDKEKDNLNELLIGDNKSQLEQLESIFEVISKLKKEMKKSGKATAALREINELEKSESPWIGIDIPFGYKIDYKGVFKVTEKKKNEGGTSQNIIDANDEEKLTEIKICDPIWVAGRSRDFLGSNSGLILKFIDMDIIQREICIERKKFHANGNQIAIELAHNNLSIIPGKEKELDKYLEAFKTKITYRSVKSLGWLENPVGDLIYVSKYRTFKNTNTIDTEEIIFQSGTALAGPSALDCNGSLEDWKENIANQCKGNDLPIFLQSHAMSGLIIKFADTGSDGVHIAGFTSRGKTTVAQTAASVSGCAPDPSNAPSLSIIKTWHTTSNALESLASQSSDSVLVLDEIGKCPNSDLDKVIYNLFGGRGKERLTQQSQHRETRNWCTAVISTGERSLQERLAETNSKTPPGLFVRFIDLHVDEVFTNYHSEDPKSFIDKLKVNCGRYYGTPGSAFVQEIINRHKNIQNLRESIVKGCAEIAKEISDKANLTQEHLRVLKLFSFIALTGTWASEWEIFPYSKEDIISSARNLFIKWLSGNKKQTEDVRCICAIRDYYIKKRESSFRPQFMYDKDRRYTDIFGYTTNEGKFFLTEEGLFQALSGLPKKAALKALNNKKYLLREEDPKRNESKKTMDGIGQLRVYVISEKICEFDEESV